MFKAAAGTRAAHLAAGQLCRTPRPRRLFLQTLVGQTMQLSQAAWGSGMVMENSKRGTQPLQPPKLRGVVADLQDTTWVWNLLAVDPTSQKSACFQRETIKPEALELTASCPNPTMMNTLCKTIDFLHVCLAGISPVSNSNLLFQILLVAKKREQLCWSLFAQRYHLLERKSSARYYSWELFLHPFLLWTRS